MIVIIIGVLLYGIGFTRFTPFQWQDAASGEGVQPRSSSFASSAALAKGPLGSWGDAVRENFGSLIYIKYISITLWLWLT